MSIPRHILIAILAAIFLLLGAFFYWHFSPERVVQRQLSSFLESVTFKEGEGAILRSFQTDKFVSHLAESVAIRAPIQVINRDLSIGAMRSGHSYLVTQAQYVNIDYDALVIKSIDSSSAEVVAILKLDAKVKHEPHHKMKLLSSFILQKGEEGWKINAITLHKQ